MLSPTAPNIFLCNHIPTPHLGKTQVEEMFPIKTLETTAICKVLYALDEDGLFLYDFYDCPYYSDVELRKMVEHEFNAKNMSFIAELWDRIVLSRYPDSEKTSIYSGAFEVARAKKLVGMESNQC